MEPPRAPSPPMEQQLVSGSIQREALRAKWEQEEMELRDKDNIHYQDILYDGEYSFNVVLYPRSHSGI